MIRQYLIGIAFTLLGLAALGVLESVVTGNVVEEEKTIVYFPKSADFPNIEEGTVVFEFQFPSTAFKVGNKDADVLIFLDSEAIKGLRVGYDIAERKLKAGLPTIESGQLDIMDGQKHTLAYSFHRKNQQQSLYLDGGLVTQGEFTGQSVTKLTGYAVHQRITAVKSSLPIVIRFE